MLHAAGIKQFVPSKAYKFRKLRVERSEVLSRRYDRQASRDEAACDSPVQSGWQGKEQDAYGNLSAGGMYRSELNMNMKPTMYFSNQNGPNLISAYV